MKELVEAELFGRILNACGELESVVGELQQLPPAMVSQGCKSMAAVAGARTQDFRQYLEEHVVPQHNQHSDQPQPPTS